MKNDLYTLLKENAFRQLDFQSLAIESIERKVGILLGAILATPSIVHAIKQSGSVNLLFAISLVVSAISALFSVMAFWSKDVSLPANLESFFNENKNKSLVQLRINFIDDCCRAIESNAKKLKKKGHFFNVSLVLFCIAVFILILSLSQGLPQRKEAYHGCKQKINTECYNSSIQSYKWEKFK